MDELCKAKQLLDDGVLTPEVVHPANYTFKLPDHVSFAEGAMVEPFAVGMQASGENAGAVFANILRFENHRARPVTDFPELVEILRRHGRPVLVGQGRLIHCGSDQSEFPRRPSLIAAR